MTKAVCWKCGEFKSGSFVPCPVCNADAETDDEDQSRINNEIEKNIYALKNTNNILSIQAIFDNFEKNKLPSLINSLVENDNQNIISSSSIRLNNNKLILESEEDVNDYIEAYKNAILEEIRSGNKIKI